MKNIINKISSAVISLSILFPNYAFAQDAQKSVDDIKQQISAQQQDSSSSSVAREIVILSLAGAGGYFAYKKGLSKGYQQGHAKGAQYGAEIEAEYIDSRVSKKRVIIPQSQQSSARANAIVKEVQRQNKVSYDTALKDLNEEITAYFSNQIPKEKLSSSAQKFVAIVDERVSQYAKDMLPGFESQLQTIQQLSSKLTEQELRIQSLKDLLGSVGNPELKMDFKYIDAIMEKIAKGTPLQPAERDFIEQFSAMLHKAQLNRVHIPNSTNAQASQLMKDVLYDIGKYRQSELAAERKALQQNIEAGLAKLQTVPATAEARPYINEFLMKSKAFFSKKGGMFILPAVLFAAFSIVSCTSEPDKTNISDLRVKAKRVLDEAYQKDPYMLSAYVGQLANNAGLDITASIVYENQDYYLPLMDAQYAALKDPDLNAAADKFLGNNKEQEAKKNEMIFNMRNAQKQFKPTFMPQF